MSQTSIDGDYDTAHDSTHPFAPHLHTYVAFSIDPVATVASLEDPDATEAARILPTRKYVGFVETIHDLRYPSRPYHRCNIALLSQGLPIDVEEYGIKPSMCVPAAPTEGHPLSRAPLRPTKPLPWDDVYHHSHMMFSGRIRTAPADHTDATMITGNDAARFQEMLSEDEARRHELEVDSENISDRPLTPTSPEIVSDTASDSSMGIPAASSTAGSLLESESDGNEPLSVSLGDLEPERLEKLLETLPRPRNPVAYTDSESEGDLEPVASSPPSLGPSIFMQSLSLEDELVPSSPTSLGPSIFMQSLSLEEDPAYLTMPVVDVDYDLSSIGDLTDPRLLLDEIAALEQIVEESRARAEARDSTQLISMWLDSQVSPNQPAMDVQDNFIKPSGLFPSIVRRARGSLGFKRSRSSGTLERAPASSSGSTAVASPSRSSRRSTIPSISGKGFLDLLFKRAKQERNPLNGRRRRHSK